MEVKIDNDEKEVEIIAEKVLARIRDKIKNQIGNEFYKEYSNYLYEHYVNHKDKIDEQLIKEMGDKFVADPKLYKFLDFRKRIYAENKEEIQKVVTEDIIREGLSILLLRHTSNNFPFNWQWKEGIVALVLANWDKFKDDERIKSAFGQALEQKQAHIEWLENKLTELTSEREE